MIRVLHIIPSFVIGGAERMAVHLISALDKKDFAVAAVSLFSKQGTDLETILESRGYRVSYLGKKIGFDFSIFRKLNCVIRDFKPDVIHTHGYLLPYVFPLVLFRSVSVHVHTIHTVPAREVGRIGRVIQWIAFRLGVVPVAISSEFQTDIEQLYGLKRFPIIPNGIPVKYYSASERSAMDWKVQNGFALDSCLILTIGRLAPVKNQTLLIKAFARGLRQLQQCHLVIAGDGELRTELEMRSAETGLKDRVHFLGIRSDIPTLLSAVDVFVLSSDHEGNPLTVMEAMAAGKAVISTAVGGAVNLIEDGKDGFLVSAGDEIGLAKRMFELVNNVALRRKIGERAAETARREFDVSLMANSYSAIYKNLVKEQGK